MWTNFEQNVYTPMELAKAMIHCDNSKCRIDVKEIVFRAEQKIALKAGHHKYCFENTLAQSSKSGPKAEQGGFQTEMTVDLSKIKYDCPEYKKKKGKQKKVSPEDMFMIKSIQAATDSKMISVEYFLHVYTVYDGCTCCAECPDANMKFTIVPIVNPACIGYQPPQNFEPYHLGFFQCNVEFDD